MSTEEMLFLPRLPRWTGHDPALSASIAEVNRAAAAILAEPGEAKPRHAGGRRRLHWEAIRRAYDTLSRETLARFDTDAKLYRCLARKLNEDGIVVSDDTMRRALAGYRICRKT